MSTFLSRVTTGVLKSPVLVTLYGVPGVGKSTWAADAPDPIFVGPERGTKRLAVARMPQPVSFQDVIGQLTELTIEKHPYKTVVVDSIDEIEPMIFQQVCDENLWKSIETPGFGKGYEEAVPKWLFFRERLQMLQDKTGMNIILLAHAHVKTFRDPESGHEYDRYEMKLHKKAIPVFNQFCDAILFAKEADTVVKDRASDRKAKAFGEGKRVVYTQRRPAFEAKNRYSLPFKMNLSWPEFYTAFNTFDTRSPEEVLANIKALCEKLQDAEQRTKIEKAVADAGLHMRTLKAYEERLFELAEPKTE